MIVKIENNRYIQICEKCGAKIEHKYKDVKMKKDNVFINLPPCSTCNSIEFIYLNNVDNKHGQKVSRLFAKAHAEKAKKDKDK